ncbi:hypothetical protein KEJ15_02885 [Candidatus Bathyarchaeota archaeon]|nr:hypothetical protein [Candidatus Bathyarchaeota archaeon]
MTESLVLFIRSEKVEITEWTLPGGAACQGAIRAVNTERLMSEEDKKAIETLEKTGLRFTLIDLGLVGTAERVKARLDGIKLTPTLVYNGQKYEGLRQIITVAKDAANVPRK